MVTGALGWRCDGVSGTPNHLTLDTIIFIFFAGTLGGALNSVAGGGSFIAFPALLFTGVPPIPANATNTIAGGRRSVIEHAAGGGALVAATFFQLCVAVYGGYFGGGMGIVMLAMLAALGMTDIHAMNALKSVMGFVINGVAVVTFIVAKAVYWQHGTIMIVGGIAGGFLGAHYAMKLPQIWIRWFVVLVGAGMTIYFFRKSY